MATYTNRGSVRGECGHRHRTIRAALACQERDDRGCRSQGGHSDRFLVRTDGEDLTEWEHDELARLREEEGRQW